MTSYNAIVNGEIDANSPLTADLMSKLRDNPLSIGESATGAPVNQVGWHPYNNTLNGTNTGLFYDQAVNGTVANVVSPDFVDGYEYMFLFNGMSVSTNPVQFQVELYKATSAAYSPTIALTAATLSGGSNYPTGKLEIPFARRSLFAHVVTASLSVGGISDSAVSVTSYAGAVTHITQQPLLRARFSFSSGNINGGKIYMYRRRID